MWNSTSHEADDSPLLTQLGNSEAGLVLQPDIIRSRWCKGNSCVCYQLHHLQSSIRLNPGQNHTSFVESSPVTHPKITTSPAHSTPSHSIYTKNNSSSNPLAFTIDSLFQKSR